MGWWWKTRKTRGTTQGGSRDALAAGYHRLLFEQNLAGVYFTTMDGEILDCNNSFARLLGYETREEMLQLRAMDLYRSPADRKDFIDQLKRDRVLTDSELCLRRKDGSTAFIIENVSLVEEDGQPIILGTMVDITARRAAEEALRESEQRYKAMAENFRRLSNHQRNLRDKERARIARELHDELGQELTALNMDLHWLREQTSLGSAEATARFVAMRTLLEHTMGSVRRICNDLRPAVLDDLGLIAAVEWQARDFTSHTGIPCHVHLPKDDPTLLPGICTGVFRVLQESLTNVAKHTRATRVDVHLRIDQESLVLVVKDDGVGVSDRDTGHPDSYGLVGMRERAIDMGGQTLITGKPGQGTTVRLELPLENTKTGQAS